EVGIGYPTSVVGTLSNGSGPTIAIRADMDALPISEETGHSFCSQNQGVMHACGHDAHTSILLGVAHLLAEDFQKKKMKGTVKFLFQPAEESSDENGMTGASYMVRDGVMEGLDCVIALHVDSRIQMGEVKMASGYGSANCDDFKATIY